MKTKSTLFLLLCTSFVCAQQNVTTFESFTLAPNSAYTSTTSTPFQSTNAVFPYKWDNANSYWSGGFTYTNIQDSATGTFSNLYGVKALTGYSNSSFFGVGQNGGTIKLKTPYNQVSGFYITNTTFAYKVIKNGNSFSRKFGDTTYTGSGTTIAQGSYPDYFKITVKGFKNGNLKSDSVEFYLADYRFSNNALDYVVDSWMWVNTLPLAEVDSIRFFMYSSDVGMYGMNTPAFFALDNFTTDIYNSVGVVSVQKTSVVNVSPNPFSDLLKINGLHKSADASLVLKDISGREIFSLIATDSQTQIETNELAPGIYFLEINQAGDKSSFKIIKN